MLRNALLGLVSLALSLLVADWVLGRLTQDAAYTKAVKQGMAYDTRDRLRVILDNRRADANWFPAVPANTYLETHLKLGSERILPLGGVARARVVGCNEGGFYSSFATDEAGFHNPPGTWPLKNDRHIFLVGDSFTQGDCVKEGEGIAERLRLRHPEVVNLGVGGNGPLLELAAIREYVPAGKTALVFWLYYEGNDLMDLQRDLRDPVLRRYLDAGFSQNLLPRQGQINERVRNYAEGRIRERSGGQALVFPNLRGALWRVRHGQGLIVADKPQKSDKSEADADQFLKILASAKQEVEAKGGQLVFVLLPEYYRFSGEPLSTWAGHSEELKKRVAGLGVSVIDTEPRLRRHPDPLSLFPFRLKGHYTGEGYALVAEVMSEFLNSKHGRAE